MCHLLQTDTDDCAMQFKVDSTSTASSTDSVINLINAPVVVPEDFNRRLEETIRIYFEETSFEFPFSTGIIACASRDLTTIQGGTACPDQLPPPNPNSNGDPAAVGPYAFYVQWVVTPTDMVNGTCPAANASIVTSLVTMMEDDIASATNITTRPVVTVNDTFTRVSIRRKMLPVITCKKLVPSVAYGGIGDIRGYRMDIGQSMGLTLQKPLGLWSQPALLRSVYMCSCSVVSIVVNMSYQPVFGPAGLACQATNCFYFTHHKRPTQSCTLQPALLDHL